MKRAGHVESIIRAVVPEASWPAARKFVRTRHVRVPLLRSTLRREFGQAAPLWTPLDATGVLAVWDTSSAAKAAGNLVVGGYDLTPASDHYFSRTSGAIPGVSEGTPSYPLTVVARFKPDNTSGNGYVVSLDDGGSTEHLAIYRSGDTVRIASTNSGGSSAIATAAASVTAGRWHCVIGVWGAANARAIYMDTDSTGATNATNRPINTLANMHVGRLPNGSAELDGTIGPIHVLPGDFSGASFASQRAAIFAGADPVSAFGLTPQDVLAHYAMDNDSGADSGPNGYGLTAQNSPTAQSNLLVVRDPVGDFHLRATTAAPTWSADACGGRGGYVQGSSTFLVHEAAPVAAAPFQVYAVASTPADAGQQAIFWLGDKDASNQFWLAGFEGDHVGDGLRFYAENGATTAISRTSSNYTADQLHLLWAIEASTTSRAVRIDGADEGTSTTSAEPSGADRVAVGMARDSTPGQQLASGAEVGLVVLLGTASTDDRANFHAYVNRSVEDGGFGLSVSE